MTGNYPQLDLVAVDVHTRFGQILSSHSSHKKIGQILTICSQGIEQKQNSDINQGQNSVKILQKTTGNNPKLDLDVHTKFGKILSIHSQYIEWKIYSDINQGL